MKRFLKYLVLIIIAFVIILTIVAKIYEDRIADLAFKKVSEIIKCPMEINGASFTLLRRFPLASVEFSGVWLGSPESIDSSLTKVDTLASIEKLFVSVKSGPLIKGVFEIARVEVKGVHCNYLVDTAGVSNFDFIKNTFVNDTVPEPVDTNSVAINLLLQRLSLEDIYLYYQDEKMKVHTALFIPEIEVSARLNDSITNASITGSLVLSDLFVDNTNLHSLKQAEVIFDLSYHTDSLNIKSFSLETDEISLNIDGGVLIADTIDTDLRILKSDIDIGKLKKFAPKELRELGLSSINGLLSIDGTIKGDYINSIMPKIAVNFSLEQAAVKYKDYPELENLEFKGEVTNGDLRNNKSTKLAISSFIAETENSSIKANIEILNLDKPQFKVRTQFDLGLQEFSNYVPDTLLADISGNILIDFATKGVLPDSITPQFIDKIIDNSSLAIVLRDLRLDIDSNLYLDSLSGNITYSDDLLVIQGVKVQIPSYQFYLNNFSVEAQKNGGTADLGNMGVNLSSFQLLSNMFTLSGSAALSNLRIPDYNFICRTGLNLNEISKIVPDSVATEMSGTISTTLTSNGSFNLDSIATQITEIIFTQSKLNAKLKDINIRTLDSLIRIDDFSAIAELNPSQITVNDLKGAYKGIDFWIDSLRLRNLYQTIIKEEQEQLLIDVALGLGDLDYSMLAIFVDPSDSLQTDSINTTEIVEKSDTTTVESDYVLDYNIKGSLSINSITYNKVLAEDISAKFNVSDSLYLLEDFTLHAFDGIMKTSAKYKYFSNGNTGLWVNNQIENMDVTRLLKDFDDFADFTEPSISHKNISGILGTNFDVYIPLKNNEFNTADMRTKGDLKIEKGGVYNYKPVEDVAKYIPGIKDLKTLEFKTLNSSIFIFKDAIYVPQTNIVSNKLDASFFGMQSFGEDYSYHAEVFLGDILLGKSKKVKKKQDNKGDDIKDLDRKGTKVRSYSIDGESKSGLDNDSDRKKMLFKIKASNKLLNLRFTPKAINYRTGVE